MESVVYQGENETNLLDNNSFTLSGGGSRGDAKYRVTDVENGNTTEITNAVSNQIDYTVEKKWKSGAQEGPVTFALYRTIGEQSLTETCKVLTFTMDAGGTVNVDFTKENAFIDAIDGEISIQFSEAWKALLQNLPEYDEEGRRYEYLILEENGNPTYETSIDSSTGDYTTIVTNGPGGSHRILVQKNWVDDSDAAHREPVEVTVYSRNGDEVIVSVTLGESQEDGGSPSGTHGPALENLRRTRSTSGRPKSERLRFLEPKAPRPRERSTLPESPATLSPAETMPMKLHTTARRSRVRRSAPSPTAGWAMWT